MKKKGDGRRNSESSKSSEASWPIETIFLLVNFAFVDKVLGHKGRGRKGYKPSVLLKCLLLIPLGYAPSIRRMVKKLRHNQRLAKAIGLPMENRIYRVPHRTTFSKFIARIARNPLGLTLVFSALVFELIKAGIIIGKEIAVDATPIWAWCRPTPKGSRKRRADKDAKWGYKWKGRKEIIWVFGYKVHVVVDVLTELPIAFFVTAANRNEGRVFRVLLKAAASYGLAIEKVLADAAYDFNWIRKKIIKVLKAIPLISLNPRNCRGKSEREKKKRRDENLRRWYKKEGLEEFYVPHRSRKYKGVFKNRSASERNHSNGKGQLHLDNLRLRGLEKATVHVALCLIAELAVALTAVHVGRPDLIRCSTCFTA